MSDIILKISHLDVSIKGKKILKDIDLVIPDKSITAVIGPPGSGKSFLLKSINRLVELESEINISGDILYKDERTDGMDISLLRRKIGMILNIPTPFPAMTIYDNVLAGFVLNGIKLQKQETDNIVQYALKTTGVWDQFKDYLHKKTAFLTTIHQQQLCFARAIAMQPGLLLLDEPSNYFNPKDTDIILDMIGNLKKMFAVILATHDISQAGKIADHIAIIYNGRIVEYGETKKIFTTPSSKITEDYLMGKYSV